MNKTLGFVWALVVIILIPSVSIAETQPIKLDCEVVLRQIQQAGTDSRAASRARASFPTELSWNRKVIADIRAWMLLKLQLLNEDPYPYVHSNEAPLATAWAKRAFGRLTEGQQALLKPEVIDADLTATLDRVTAYPKRLEGLIDTAANLVMEQAALDRAKGRWFPTPRSGFVNRLSQGSVQVEIPYFENGELQSELRVEHYGSVAQFLIEGQKNVGRRLGLIAAELRALGMQQAINTQKLEVYVHEFLRQKSEDPTFDLSTLDPKYVAFINRVHALYASNEVDGLLKSEFAPPYAAWSKWRWRAFARQVVSIWWKKKAGNETSTTGERFSGEDLWKFIGTLSDQEKRALGLGNVVNGVAIASQSKWVRWLNVFKRSKWGRIAMTSVLPLIAGTGVGLETKDEFGQPWLVGTAKEFMADFFERDKCVHTELDSEFKQCVARYLQTRFPKQYLYDLMDWETLVAGGQIRDVKIQAVVEEIKSERRVYQQNKKLGTLLANALDTALEDPADVTSDVYRKNLVRSKDEGSMIARLLSPKVGAGYFATRYPYAYQLKEIRAILRVAIQNRDEPTVWKTSLLKLRENRFGAEIATELERFMADRAAFLATQETLSKVDALIEEAISVDLGIHEDEN